MTAAYLINRTSMPLLSDQTPFRILFGNEADYSLVRTFGCWHMLPISLFTELSLIHVQHHACSWDIKQESKATGSMTSQRRASSCQEMSYFSSICFLSSL